MEIKDLIQHIISTILSYISIDWIHLPIPQPIVLYDETDLLKFHINHLCVEGDWNTLFELIDANRDDRQILSYTLLCLHLCDRMVALSFFKKYLDDDRYNTNKVEKYYKSIAHPDLLPEMMDHGYLDHLVKGYVSTTMRDFLMAQSHWDRFSQASKSYAEMIVNCENDMTDIESLFFQEIRDNTDVQRIVNYGTYVTCVNSRIIDRYRQLGKEYDVHLGEYHHPVLLLYLKEMWDNSVYTSERPIVQNVRSM